MEAPLRSSHDCTVMRAANQSEHSEMEDFLARCYTQLRTVLEIADWRSLRALVCASRTLAILATQDSSLALSRLSTHHDLILPPSLLARHSSPSFYHASSHHTYTASRPMLLPPCPAWRLLKSLSSFNPSHLALTKSSRLSVPRSLEKVPSKAFFLLSKLVFVFLHQDCSIIIFDFCQFDLQGSRKLPTGQQEFLRLPFQPSCAVAIEETIWLLNAGMKNAAIFNVRTHTWQYKEILGVGPKSSDSNLVYLSVQKMLVCASQTRSGFFLYFLDTKTCTWVKRIQCSDLEATLLPCPQLLCFESTLMVLLTSASGNLHFLQIDCIKWQLQLVPVVGTMPCENAREFLSLSMFFPWKGTLLMVGRARGRGENEGKRRMGSTSSRVNHIYMLSYDNIANNWSWCSQQCSIPDPAAVKSSFICEGQLIVCTNASLHVLDLFSKQEQDMSVKRHHKLRKQVK